MTDPMATDREQDALGRELQVTDWWLVHTLRRFGLDRRSACLVPWLPAIELAWVDGLTAAERRQLLGLLYARHPALDRHAIQLLEGWLAARPADALFRIARRTLRAQLMALPVNERAALRARVIGPCVAVADASGGLFGFAAKSRPEHAWLQRLAITLRAVRTNDI
jgi:hypothetical protein